MSIQDVTTGIGNLASILLRSANADKQPTYINFATRGETVYGAEVVTTEWFCDTMNFYVTYPFKAYDGSMCVMTQWVTLGQVI